MTREEMELLKKEFGSKLEIREVNNGYYKHVITYNGIIAGNENLNYNFISNLIKTYSVFGYNK